MFLCTLLIKECAIILKIQYFESVNGGIECLWYGGLSTSILF